MTEKPSILFILNDHQAYYRHGWDGGVRPMTPYFDRLASEGIRFNRSYVAEPLCGPTRRSLLTGLYAHNHGRYFNYTENPYAHEVYLNTLAENGYRNFYFGKWHAGPGAANDHNSEGFSYTDYGNPYITPEYKAYLEENDLPPAEHFIERVFRMDDMVRQFPDLQENERYRCNKNWCGEHAIGLTVTPKETHADFFVASLACRQLEEIAANAGDQPFHMRVDFWGPHQPFFPTQEFADLYNPADIEVYGNFHDDLKNKPDIYHRERNEPLGKDDRLIIPNPLPWSEWQHILARCYAQITMIDAAGGMVLQKLEELGLADNTIVIWTSDHGDAIACHGGHFDKSSYMPEEIVRTPLAMRYPGVIAPGSESDHLVNQVDLPPTILDAAGLQFSQPVDGASLLPLVRGENAVWRDATITETFGHGYGEEINCRAVITGRYKFIANSGQLNELYDLQEDPYELNNLIDQPGYADVQAFLTEKLLAWQAESGDPHPVLD